MTIKETNFGPVCVREKTKVQSVSVQLKKLPPDIKFDWILIEPFDEEPECFLVKNSSDCRAVLNKGQMRTLAEAILALVEEDDENGES